MLKWFKAALAAAFITLLATYLPALAQSVSGGITLLLAGNVGGYNANFFSQTTSTTVALTANYSIGGTQTVPVFRTTSQPSGTLNYISLTSKGGMTTSAAIWAWTKSPASTCTDHAAFVQSTTDTPYLVPGFPITLTPAATNSQTPTQGSQPIVASIKNADTSASANLYFCIVTTGTPTLGSASDIGLEVSISQD